MKIWRRRLIWAGLGLVSWAALYLITVLGIWFLNSDGIMPGVTIAGVSYAGQADEEIRADLERRTGEYLAQEGLVEYKVTYDLDKTIGEAKKAIKNPFLLGRKVDVPLNLSFDQEVLYQKLAAVQKQEKKAVINPVIVKKGEGLTVQDGAVGQRVLYGENISIFREEAGRLKGLFAPRVTEIPAAYSREELEKNLQRANELAIMGLTLEYSEQKFAVPEEEIASWVTLQPGEAPQATRFTEKHWLAVFGGGNGTSSFDSQKISNYLSSIAEKIDRDPIDATLKIQDGKAAIFSLSQTGLLLNLGESVIGITDALEVGETESTLVVDVVQPKITQNSLASLGIVELIAEGRSNFAGSPANRRHNIRVGAAQFDGVLLDPGEVFSFTKNLGAVDASTGYLPELVIKDKGTVPEYGGGLCQVSTTTFRAALNAGLPITARRPHAYPVTYYKPYGTDATIYIPNPDLKFINDTGHHILIQTRIVGNYLYFDFYGTKKSTTVKFAGNKEGTGAVTRIEDVKPTIYGQGAQGEGSFTAVFWQFIYSADGKLIKTDDFVSKYDSPLKYPH
jgi:vancomycin resistance protein YoaR